MKCYAEFYLGSNYGVFGEPHRSLAAVAERLQAMVDNTDRRTPCVDEAGAEALIYLGTDEPGDCPDRRVSFGPRGGVRVERC